MGDKGGRKPEKCGVLEAKVECHQESWSNASNGLIEQLL